MSVIQMLDRDGNVAKNPDGTAIEIYSLQEYTRRLAAANPEMVMPYYLTPYAKSFAHTVRKQAKVGNSPFTEEEADVLFAVFDKVQNVHWSEVSYMGRQMSDFDVPVELSSLILPRKLTLGVGSDTEAVDYLWHVADDVIDSWRKNSTSITYQSYLDAVVSLYSAFRIQPHLVKLSTLTAVASITGDLSLSCGYGDKVYTRKNRPVPCLLTPTEGKWNVYGVNSVMDDILWETVLNLAAGRTSVAATPADKS